MREYMLEYIYSHVIFRNKNYPVKSFSIRHYDLGIPDNRGHNQWSSQKGETFLEVQEFLLIPDSRGIRFISMHSFIYLLLFT